MRRRDSLLRGQLMPRLSYRVWAWGRSVRPSRPTPVSVTRPPRKPSSSNVPYGEPLRRIERAPTAPARIAEILDDLHEVASVTRAEDRRWSK